MSEIIPGARHGLESGAVRMTGACARARLSGDGHRAPDGIDELDARLLRELDAAPRVGVLELSRRWASRARPCRPGSTGSSRRGVIATFAPTLDPEALGFTVTAFATLEIRQGRGGQVLDHLRGIPEVLEVHTITGQGDMLCRVVARSNDDLQHVLDRRHRVRGDRAHVDGDRVVEPDLAPGAAARQPD